MNVLSKILLQMVILSWVVFITNGRVCPRTSWFLAGTIKKNKSLLRLVCSSALIYNISPLTCEKC